MGATMKAAQYDKPADKVVINDVPIPEPGEGQILLKVTAASLCHSDLMNELRPDDFGRPMTMGHEGVGVVHKLHQSAEGKGFKAGDKVGCLYIVSSRAMLDAILGWLRVDSHDGRMTAASNARVARRMARNARSRKGEGRRLWG